VLFGGGGEEGSELLSCIRIKYVLRFFIKNKVHYKI
jgi:hypothetical protein